ERAGLVAALLLTAGLAWPLRHYVTDDTYIHLRYAQQLAHGEGFVFNSGERVYGTTSPLWVLALGEAMAIGIDGLLASKLLGALATLASLLLWWALVRRTLVSPLLRVAATLAWAGHAWMLRWSLSGMETPLAVCLVLLPLWAMLLLVDHGVRPGLRLALRTLWPGALVLGGWLAFAQLWFGRLWPNTLAAKAAGGEGLAYHLDQLTRQAV